MSNKNETKLIRGRKKTCDVKLKKKKKNKSFDPKWCYKKYNDSSI